MMVRYLKLDAFTREPFTGNPAGVVPDAGGLSDGQMQKIAAEINASETAFVTPGEKADFRVRFFSPKTEVPLCGHATVAAFFALDGLGRLPVGGQVTVTQHTSVGVLPVHIFRGPEGTKIMMEQNPPEFVEADISPVECADALNIGVGEINAELPIMSVSTGNMSLKVPVRNLAGMQNMRPDFSKVEALTDRAGAGCLHAFTFQTLRPESTSHNRNFSPHHGINEDPVTGTASGSLAAYLVRNRAASPGRMLMEQGHEIGRPGKIEIEINEDMSRILVGGSAVAVMEGNIIL